jgi:hypothetical protein
VRLVDLAPSRGAVDRDELLSRLPAPALVVPRLVASSKLAIKTIVDLDEARLDPRARDLSQAEVLFLVKSTRNPFATMITVGRATNNDVILAAATVSKFHASFAQGAAGWTITDQRSANGTWLEAMRLEPGASVPLGDEAWLRFGKDLWVKYATPERLVRLIAGLRSGSV